MCAPSENDNWLIDTGDTIIGKKAAEGVLTLRERLIYCLWVTDYGMRNSGDLDAARDVYATFQEEGAVLAKSLSLKFTEETFSLPDENLQRQYFERFDRVCDEIKRA